MIRNKFLRILFSGGGKSEEKNEKKKFDYLDGMRGSLALSVLVRHGTLYYGLSKDMPFFWQLGDDSLSLFSSFFSYFIRLLYTQ